jgi:DNA invertase Pin-like site-specific DNA recombinase
MPSASLYVRLSREANRTNLSLGGMLDDVRALADRLGYDVHATHVDNGVSGSIRDRPEFLAWLHDARSGAVDALLTYHADRISREGINAGALVLDTVEGKDPVSGKVVRDPVRLVDCHGLDSDDSDAFRWRFVIAAEVARSERERIRSRSLQRSRRLAEAGRWNGGAPGFGCRAVPNPDGAGKVIEPDPVTAPVLREAAERVLRGDSILSVAKWLNREGWKPARAAEWRRSSVRAALLSRAAREHVLDLATADAVREIIEANVHPTGGRPARLLLHGLAACASCGRIMAPRSGRGYVCVAESSGELCPAPVSISSGPVDAYVEAEYLRTFGRLEYLEPHVVITGADDYDAAARALEAARAALLADPEAASLAAYSEARARFELAEKAPRSRERVLLASGRTLAQLWHESEIPDRTALLADVLAGPVVLSRRPGGRRGGPVDVERRTHVPWRQE